jgi:hypothetical protein
MYQVFGLPQQLAKLELFSLIDGSVIIGAKRDAFHGSNLHPGCH